MRQIIILAMLLNAPIAAAQTVKSTPPAQVQPQVQAPLWRPLDLNPKLPPLRLDTMQGLSAAPTAPTPPGATSRSGYQPPPPTFMPSLERHQQPDSMPPDRRPEVIPGVRLKVPL